MYYLCVSVLFNVEDFVRGSSYNPKDSCITQNDISVHIFHIIIYNIRGYYYNVMYFHMPVISLFV